MKKPKKTAKPLSTETKRSRVKTGARTLKAKPVAAKKTAAKKPRKAAAAGIKRKTKAKPLAAEPVSETKPPVQPVTPKRPSASAKAAPKSPLFDIRPVLMPQSAAKVISLGDLKPKVPPLPKPKLSPEELPADEKPEMGVELIITRKKAPAKARAKTKRVTKSKSTEATPLAAETKAGDEVKSNAETKPAAEKPAPIVTPPEAKQSSRPARKIPANIPPILLEGDKAPPAPVSGPGHRYALGPTPPVEKLQTEGELPESYGTGTILLAARDPHWLYAHWDLSGDQRRRYNAFSRDGHLIVRVYVEATGGKPVAQVHVHPESRHWFVNVDRANTRYVAELGYYSAADKWTVVATSAATLTPPDAVSKDTTAEFGTMPFEVPMEKLVSLVKEAVQENAPLAQTLQELRADGHPELPRIEVPTHAAGNGQPRPAASAGKKSSRPRWTPCEWTAAQERALAEVISMDHVRRVWMGSLEITELIRRQFVNELASMAAAEMVELAPGAPTSPAGAMGGISSPTAQPGAREKGFWFNVNAELIVYGATEKDATVSIAGRRIKLRPDGSFSYRFALPDGNYEMPVVAISADQTDGRAAELKFSRGTEYRGEVGAHPQDPSLQPLMAENF